MLVLTRKRGESVVIDGGKIEVKFLEMNEYGSAVLGFTAPDDVVIDREEIHRRKMQDADGGR